MGKGIAQKGRGQGKGGYRVSVGKEGENIYKTPRQTGYNNPNEGQCYLVIIEYSEGRGIERSIRSQATTNLLEFPVMSTILK